MSKVHKWATKGYYSHLCGAVLYDPGCCSERWKNVTCAKCLKKRPAERNEFQCAARGCDGCTVCQPKQRPARKRKGGKG